MINLNAGIHPADLTVDIEQDQTVQLENHSQIAFAKIKLTISYFDAENRYIDFEDVELEAVGATSRTRHELVLEKRPSNAAIATIDVEAEQQTFLRRHWRLISTVVIVCWGIIVLSRRLFPT